MPSSNGVYSLPPGYLAVTGGTILSSQHNPPLEDIAQALTGRLSRDGTAAMSGSLQFAPGTVNAPGAVFSTDLSTGFYKTANGIGVSVGGTKVVEFTAAGIASGNRLVGELIPFTGTAAPSPLWLLPFGQSVSRITYADLWTFAQVEIAAGSTLYNNGDGSTTFGIMDLRGRLPVAWDKMGGSASGRLTTAGSGVDGTTLGASGGGPYTQLRSDLPNVAPTFTGSSGTVNVASTLGFPRSAPGTWSASGGGNSGVVDPNSNTVNSTGSFTPAGTVQSLNGNVTQTAMKVMPPVLVTNWLLFAGGPS